MKYFATGFVAVNYVRKLKPSDMCRTAAGAVYYVRDTPTAAREWRAARTIRDKFRRFVELWTPAV